MANIVEDKANNYQDWAFNAHTWSAPIYTVGRFTPRQRWTFSDCLDLPHLAPVIADTLSSVPNPLGATATGLPFGAFLIRIEELRRGYIAINIQTVRVRANCVSWPANRNDGNTEGVDFSCEGQRFRLDPTFDVNTPSLPGARIVARAMQEYGLVMTDKAGSLATQAEDPRPYMAHNGGVDPYEKFFDPANEFPPDTYFWRGLLEIPVEHLQALPLDYGRP